MWYVVAFIAGAVLMWKVGWKLMSLVYGKGHFLKETLRSLSPDAFIRLRQAVELEDSRRNAL